MTHIFCFIDLRLKKLYVEQFILIQTNVKVIINEQKIKDK